MQVTIFKNILETKLPNYQSIDKIIDRIGKGKSKELCEKIRNCTDKAQRTELKKQLPSICFSGKFSHRANNACLEHSGLVCLDFDHVDNLKELKKSLSKDKYVMLAFISPSGDGLKVVIQIPASIDNHAASCRALKDYFKELPLDNFEDVARVCFESYDQEIYINLQSEVFTDLIHEKIVEKKVIEKTGDSNEIFEKLKVWIEKYEHYTDGNKHKFLVKFSGACNRFGITESETTNLLISHYQNAASYVKSEDIEKIVRNMYKNSNQFNTSFFEKTGIAYEKNNSKRLNDDFFTQYTDEETEHPLNLDEFYKIAQIHFDEEYVLPTCLVKIKEGSQWLDICTLGNFSAFTGKSKARKSFASHFLMAGCIANKTIQNKFIIKMPVGKENVIYFDTEQSKSHVARASFGIVKMAEVNSIDNFKVFALRPFGHLDRCKIIEEIISKTSNLGMVIIDGIADLAFGNNDENEANRVAQLLMTWTSKYDIHVNTVIHQTKGNDWATGHLGSAIEKKAETVINIKKDGKYSIFEPKQLRNCDDFAPFPFIINSDRLPELITEETIINSFSDNEI